MGSYIKIDRKIFEWEWYKNLNTCRLFFHILLKANWKDGKFEGKDIPRGSFVGSVKSLSLETSLTTSEVRTALKHLELTNEIAIKTYSKYSVFTVNNYNKYQDIDKQNDNQIAIKSQTISKQLATIEEYKENNIKESNTKVLPKKSEPHKNEINQFFEDVWKLYPKKRGKGQVSDSKKKLLYEIGFEELSRAIERYKAEHSEIQYMQYGSTFFTSGYVDYLDENYSKLPDNKKSRQSFDQRTYDYDELERQLIANRNNKARKRKEQN